ncbi:MAG: 4Fe-4S binding protein [Deltaproteobacteria bacterium]|nr:4Fe-4S binding protein [Deltaproteobacteria bacterium]
MTISGESLKATSQKKSSKNKIFIEIRRDWCKGCGICVAFCPKKVLELDEHEKSSISNPEACTQCGFCELHCPDMAIELILIQEGTK